MEPRNRYTQTPMPRRRPYPQGGPTRHNTRTRPRRRRGLSGRMLMVLVLPLAAVVIMMALLANAGSNTEPITGQPYREGLASRGVNESPVLPGQDYPYESNGLYFNGGNGSPENSIRLTTVPISYVADTGYLALVNRQHPIQYKPYGGILTGAWPTVAVSRVDDMYLHNSALRAVSEMFASARANDIASFFVSSGFRSYDAQTILYGDGSNSDFVQPPGHSEHHTGLAADILAPGVGMMEMAYSPEGEWLAANSYRYGLILRYPQWATHITGIAFEPWHFRYVGRVHAYFITRNNLVLEEYIAKIIDYGHISFEKNGQTYHVMHQTPHDGTISVPYDMEFLASSDNKGGFIIMAR